MRKGRHMNPDRDPANPTNPVALISGGVEPPLQLSEDVQVPANIKAQFHDWVAELLGASQVMIHSKVVVVDPFGKHPVVITGSHNLGPKANSKNDDNMVIVEGNAALAEAYAVNIIAIYQEYRFRHYVTQHTTDKNAWHGLEDNDTWQQGHLTGDAGEELKFWLGEEPAGALAVAAAAATAVGSSGNPSGSGSAADGSSSATSGRHHATQHKPHHSSNRETPREAQHHRKAHRETKHKKKR